MGAWIEIEGDENGPILNSVAPRMGAWIEIEGAPSIQIMYARRPRKGAWIEIRMVIRRGAFAGGWV